MYKNVLNNLFLILQGKEVSNVKLCITDMVIKNKVLFVYRQLTASRCADRRVVEEVNQSEERSLPRNRHYVRSSL